MNAATRHRLQEGLTVTHDWWPSGPTFKHGSYEQRRQQWTCRQCGATCAQTYASHRHGWQKPMRWFSRCEAKEPQASLFAS